MPNITGAKFLSFEHLHAISSKITGASVFDNADLLDDSLRKELEKRIERYTWGGQEKTHVSTFIPVTESLKSSKTLQRYIAQMGWDHCMVFKRGLADDNVENLMCYYVHSIWQHNKGKAPPENSRNYAQGSDAKIAVYEPLNAKELNLVPTPVPVQEVMKAKGYQCKDNKHGNDCSWILFVPTVKIPIQRIVTLGVSACSVAVFFSEDLEYVVVSHMDSSPMIPVGLAANYAVPLRPPRPMRMIASVNSEKVEFEKFIETKWNRSRFRSQNLLLVRGGLPRDEDGNNILPCMRHEQIGIEFPDVEKVQLPLGHRKFSPPFLSGYLGSSGNDPVARYRDLLPIHSTNLQNKPKVLEYFRALVDGDFRQRIHPNLSDQQLVDGSILDMINGRWGFEALHTEILQQIFKTIRIKGSKSLKQNVKDAPYLTAAKIIAKLLDNISKLGGQKANKKHPAYPVFEKTINKFCLNFLIPLNVESFDLMYNHSNAVFW